ncbi:MAG: L,D-transpeptidase [Candidatus Limnocylindria bacterium]
MDEARQILLVVRGERVQWAFHTSTGTEDSYRHPSGRTLLADTPNGRWTISWQVDGWRDGRLGRMWRPKYFHPDGIAIHGYPSVPAYPASHGCARVSMAAMNFLWEQGLAPEGSTVWVAVSSDRRNAVTVLFPNRSRVQRTVARARSGTGIPVSRAHRWVAAARVSALP